MRKSLNFFVKKSVGLSLFILSYLFSFLPYSWITLLGKGLGSIFYYTYPKFRKRILSNLSLAKSLKLNEGELLFLAKKSLQSVCISLLEFPKLYHEKSIQTLAHCENKEIAESIIAKGKGVIFFCAHQANWELFFLEGNSRMPGTAIGRPIKNNFLYDFILKVRTRFGGEIITPKSAMIEGVKALKNGKFLGIVGDQGMPESHFCSTFLGVNAYSTTAPALLAYKTNSPIIVATMKRNQGRYIISYSDPIIPDLKNSLREEVEKMTFKSLEILESSILQNPEEWLWLHNRFKQEPAKLVCYAYRHDTILIALDSFKEFDKKAIKKIYPKAFLYFYTFDPTDALEENDLYIDKKNPLPKDYRFKFVINLTSHKRLTTHFKKLSALKSLNITDLENHLKKEGIKKPLFMHEKLIYTLARNPSEIL